MATGATPRDTPPDFSGRTVGAEDLRVLIDAAPRDADGRVTLHNVNFSRATIDAAVDLAGVTFTGAASFDQAEFLGPVRFSAATFNGTARFDRAKLRGEASFAEARFDATLWFNQITADGPITFEGAAVGGDGTFDGTVFAAPVTFASALFEGDLSCDATRFAASVTFARAHMRAAASFEHAVFAGSLDLTGVVVGGRASFHNGRIQDELTAEEARFELNPELPAALEELRRAGPLTVVPSATSDLPSQDDLLGFAPVPNALYSLVDDPKTTLPLSIAITAPWGGGKSSVMRQLERLLRTPHAGYEPTRRWRTVWFDAWRYEQAERLWAALAKEIYTQPLAQMGRAERMRFRTLLDLRRLGLWRFAGKLIWPPVAAAAAVTALLAADVGKSGTAAAILSAAAAAFGGMLRYGDAIRDPFKRAIDQYASRPDYEAHLGFTSEAERDINTLMTLLCPHDRDALAIFVDDLDRCSGAHVVEIVEAMNQVFAASANRRCAFVLGLDHEVVATSIEVAYRDTVQGLRERGSKLAASYGPQFLAKLVQVTVALPRAQPANLRAMLDAVTQRAPAPATAATKDVDRVRAAVASSASGPDEVDAAGARLLARGEAPDVVGEATRLVRVEQLRDSDDVVAAEREAIDFLEPNPRQVKRFHNAFRLQLYIANENPQSRFSFTSDELRALARWVAVRLRWPTVADLMDRQPPLLEALEATANRLTDREADAALRTAHRDWFENDELLAVLSEPIAGRRLSRLPTDAFLPVA